MELACPNCGTLFFVADNAIGPNGREVRCSVCQHVWEAKPNAAPAPAAAATAPAADEKPEASKDQFQYENRTAEESPAPAAKPAPEPAAAVKPAEPPPAEPPAVQPAAEGKPKPAGHASTLEASIAPAGNENTGGGKRIAVGVILLVLVALTYVFRAEIVEQYPAAAKFYKMAGFSVGEPAAEAPAPATGQQPTSQ